MRAVEARPDEFSSLARRLGGHSARGCSADQQSINANILDAPPTYLHLYRMRPNSDLQRTLNNEHDVEHLTIQLRRVPPSTLREYQNWFRLTAAMALEISTHPELNVPLRAAYHEVCSAEGAYKSSAVEHAKGYNRRYNDTVLDKAIKATLRKLSSRQTVISLTDFLHQYVPVPERLYIESEPTSAQAFDARPFASFDVANGIASPRKRQQVVGTDIYLRYITNLSATGGLGKSTLATALATSVVTGIPLLGQPIHRMGPVAYLGLEDARDETLLRISAVTKHHRIPPDDLHGKLFVIGAEDAAQFELTHIEPGSRLPSVRDAGIEALRDLLDETRALVLIIDPLVTVVSHGLNDNALMGTLMRRLTALAVEKECAILIIHHTRKGSTAETSGADAASGAAALINLARVGLGIVPVSEAEGAKVGIYPGDAWRFFALVNTKANLAPVTERRLFERVSVDVENATVEDPVSDHVAVAVPFQPRTGSGLPIAALHHVITVIAQGCQAGPYSPSPRKGERNPVPAVAQALSAHFPKVGARDLDMVVKRALDELVSRAWIETADTKFSKTGGGSNKRKGLFVRWGATPWSADPAPGAHVV